VRLTITLCFNDLDQCGIVESGKADHRIVPPARPVALSNRFVKLIRESRACERESQTCDHANQSAHVCRQFDKLSISHRRRLARAFERSLPWFKLLLSLIRTFHSMLKEFLEQITIRKYYN